MPRRETLPEGTDHVEKGASATGAGEVGFVATADPGQARAPTGW